MISGTHRHRGRRNSLELRPAIHGLRQGGHLHHHSPRHVPLDGGVRDPEEEKSLEHDIFKVLCSICTLLKLTSRMMIKTIFTPDKSLIFPAMLVRCLVTPAEVRSGWLDVLKVAGR